MLDCEYCPDIGKWFILPWSFIGAWFGVYELNAPWFD